MGGDDEVFIAARNRALRLLTQRRRGTVELRRELARQGTPEATIDAVVALLVDRRLLDDAALAAAYVKDGVNLRRRGAVRLRWELRALGIADDLIEAALAEHCPPETEHDTARRLADSRAARLRGLPTDAARRRLAAQLQRRGFDREAIRAEVERCFPRDGEANADED